MSQPQVGNPSAFCFLELHVQISTNSIPLSLQVRAHCNVLTIILRYHGIGVGVSLNLYASSKMIDDCAVARMFFIDFFLFG